MVQVLDLPASNLEQPVSHMSSTICLSPQNIFHRREHAGVIYIVVGYIGWLHMYYGEPGRSLNWQTVLLQNSLTNQQFWLFQDYVGSGVCLFLDLLAGLSVKGFLQVLRLASLYPVRLFVGLMLQG